MIIFYFTASGNSLSVAKKIGGNLKSIPQEMKLGNLSYEDDVIGIVFPVYANEPPRMVQEFISRAKMKADYFFAIGTFGMMSGNPFKYVQREAKANGYQFDYTNCILMVDNFLDNFDVKKEVEKIPKKKIDEKLQVILADIKERKKKEMPAGVITRVVTKMCEPLYKGIISGKTSDKFLVNDQCIKCGICAKVCPAGNIIVKDGVQFSQKCEGCYACIHMCPQNAIHIKNEKSNERWINPEVSLKEIIDSNIQ
jgi:ferredoxin